VKEGTWWQFPIWETFSRAGGQDSMKLAEVCVKRRVFATMLVLTFVVLGAFS